MSDDFAQFAKALASSGGAHKPGVGSVAAPAVAVLGGGIEGRLLAALALAENASSVSLFSAYGAELNALRDSGGVTLRGEGPVGTFQTDQNALPSIRTSAELDRVVESADLLFLTGPVHKQRTYAMVLADHLRDGQTLVITPARSFAALETAWLLKTGGCRADVRIIEIQQLPYWVRCAGDNNSGPLQLSSYAAGANFAAELHLNSGSASEPINSRGLAQVQVLLANLQPLPSVIDSSFADASGAVEATALLLAGAPIIEAPMSLLPPGAEPLPERYTFSSLIDNEPCQRLLHDLLAERRAVAARFGVRQLPDNDTWITACAGHAVGAGSRPVPSSQMAQALLRCAVIGSLVPLQSAARLAALATPATDALVQLAGATLGSAHDLCAAGRKLDAFGVSANDIDDARRQLDTLARARACHTDTGAL